MVGAETTLPLVQVPAALPGTGEPEGQAKAVLDEAMNRVLSGQQNGLPKRWLSAYA